MAFFQLMELILWVVTLSKPLAGPCPWHYSDFTSLSFA
ncbi:hypothetical protein OOU_Y34scaffold00255g38 [Pyricularia oryzae Y34]|uniref:Uncharacterized protein n=2 Tax=Pyricularia oryzae TaxID=318829 RepID=A0AA97P4C6_PYRO3|nr:hypothetical protein OOU_Y34scaffold00255g38 [Pyricularia oryzae Y34]